MLLHNFGKYDSVFSLLSRMDLYHTHSLRKPLSYYLEPPILPPEDLEPEKEKIVSYIAIMISKDFLFPHIKKLMPSHFTSFEKSITLSVRNSFPHLNGINFLSPKEGEGPFYLNGYNSGYYYS